jgi:oxaloacetate decarboxylase alpha subunit
MAPLFYLTAAELGVPTLHTALPPLANGSGQPSIFAVARNMRLLGGVADIDEGSLYSASAHLTDIARAQDLPIGAPLEFDQAQFIHQVPGGVISNLKQQLKELRIAHLLDEVLDECVSVQREMGYPMMITPYSQFVVTQAAMNVALGERYKVVTDEVIRFTLGAFGSDSGYEYMDPNLKDRVLALPRAKEVQRALDALDRPEPSLDEIRRSVGSASDSDEDFLLRYIMKGDQDIAAMRRAGPHRRFDREAPGAQSGSMLALLDELLQSQRSTSVHVRRGQDHITLHS